jgi:hypothetical protein
MLGTAASLAYAPLPMKTPARQPIKVFISYSHDSDPHRRKVQALANRLRQAGVDARIDQYLNGPPPEGWPDWMLNQLDWANFVLLICTETYYRRFRRQEKPGRGKGVAWEGAIISNALYAARCTTVKFLPIIFSTGLEKYVPDALRGHIQLLNSEETHEQLYRLLTDQPLSAAGFWRHSKFTRSNWTICGK